MASLYDCSSLPTNSVMVRGDDPFFTLILSRSSTIFFNSSVRFSRVAATASANLFLRATR